MKKKFYIGGLEVGEIILFPVWKISFLVLNIYFKLLCKNYEGKQDKLMEGGAELCHSHTLIKLD